MINALLIFLGFQAVFVVACMVSVYRLAYRIKHGTYDERDDE
jgi:hypothetical protein